MCAHICTWDWQIGEEGTGLGSREVLDLNLAKHVDLLLLKQARYPELPCQDQTIRTQKTSNLSILHGPLVDMCCQSILHGYVIVLSATNQVSGYFGDIMFQVISFQGHWWIALMAELSCSGS